MWSNSLLIVLADIVLSKDYSDCKWFGGNETNAPMYPIDVCNSHSHESELDSLSLYSTKMECNRNGELTQYEWNNTDCVGDPYHSVQYLKEDGYYFNCDADVNCPYTKIVLWELRDHGNQSGSHNSHICAYDTQAYHETSIVTNICIDLMEEFNVSFYIDCNAQKVSYEEFNDPFCKTKIEGNDYFEITEGCDDPFNMNAYVQIAECDDANYGMGEKEHSHLAIVFTIIVGIIIILFCIMIASIIVKRKGQIQVNSSNNAQQEIAQPFNVDFQSIQDADEPESTQQITTAGQDIQEIPIYRDEGNMR